jgi:hypothetical protein
MHTSLGFVFLPPFQHLRQAILIDFIDYQLEELKPLLPTCAMAMDDKFPRGSVNITACLALAKKMAEIAELKDLLENVKQDEPLAYRRTFVRDSLEVEFHDRGQALVAEEENVRRPRAREVKDTGRVSRIGLLSFLGHSRKKTNQQTSTTIDHRERESLGSL